MKRLSLSIVLIMFIFYSLAQEYVSNAYNYQISRADSSFAKGLQHYANNQFVLASEHFISALDIYERYAYIDHKLDNIKCFLSLSFCYRK
jgi:hypothetical protein